MKVYFNQKHQHDYPKHKEGMMLAWYNQGKVCIVRKRVNHLMQTQNFYIREVNQVVHALWIELSIKRKREIQAYALLYKKRYPSLRKRGNNAYSIFLKICHSLIRLYHLDSFFPNDLTNQLRQLFSSLSIYKLVLKGILRFVRDSYKFNLTLIPAVSSPKLEWNIPVYSEVVAQLPVFLSKVYLITIHNKGSTKPIWIICIVLKFVIDSDIN